MKINSSNPFQNVSQRIQEELKPSEKIPIAPPPDLKSSTADQSSQTANAQTSAAAKDMSAVQDSMIRMRLENQFSQANKSESSQLTGERVLNQRDQELANNTAPDPKNPKNEDSSTGYGRSKYEKQPEGMKNLMDQLSGLYGNGGSGSGVVSGGTGGGGEGGNSAGNEGNSSGSIDPGAQQNGIFEGIGTRPDLAGSGSGPSDAVSKREDVNSRFTDLAGRSNRSATDLGSRFADRWTRVAENSSSEKTKDQGMISDGETGHTRKNPDGSETYVFDSIRGGTTYHSESTTDRDGISTITEWTTTTENDQGGIDRTTGKTEKNAWGTKTENSTTTSTDANGNVTTTQTTSETKTDENGKDSTTTTTTTTKPDGSTTTTTTTPPKDDQNSAQDGGQWDEQQFDRGRLGNLVEENWNIKAPKSSGDVDPNENADDIGRGEGEAPSMSQDMQGSVGQPVDGQDQTVGASGNVSFGGDVDYEDGSGYVGPRRYDDDLDLPGDENEIPGAIGEQQESSEEESANQNQLWDQFTRNLRRANQRS